MKVFLNGVDDNWLVFVLIFIGVIIGSSFTIALPVMWEWVKPFIHAWTA